MMHFAFFVLFVLSLALWATGALTAAPLTATTMMWIGCGLAFPPAPPA